MNTIIPNIKIGVLQNGKLLNEIVINDTRNVFIGKSLDNTITINEENFEETFQILNYSRNRYYLNINKNIEGKIFEGVNSFHVKDLINHPDAIQKNNAVSYPLSNDTRGMLLIGNNTILFKLYSAEPIPKRLPKEFRGNFFGGYFDISFFVILLFIIAGYVVLINSFSKVKPRTDINFEKIPERFARLIMDNPVPVKKEEKIVEQKVEERAKELEKKAENKKNNTEKTEANKNEIKRNTIKPGGNNEEKKIAEVVRSSGIIGVIGSRGKGGNIANLFQEQGFNTKLDKALKGVSGLYAGTSIKEAKMKRGSGDATGIEIGSLKATTGSGLIAFGPQSAAASNILGDIGSKDIGGSGSMNPSVIAKTLAQYIGAFQYCYNKALQGNPRLKGELKVRFTILMNGMTDKNTVSFLGAAARDTSLTSCIYRVFSRIKFPSPKGGEVTVSYPMNFTAQN
ncbi:MAG: AgmX/PglI C-terminal domain-containing protein [Proteobacteria bacterium]|nr:AgmX/PglI C-terminal domain-containing protein [Pseudomonadota bacterium]